MRRHPGDPQVRGQFPCLEVGFPTEPLPDHLDDLFRADAARTVGRYLLLCRALLFPVVDDVTDVLLRFGQDLRDGFVASLRLVQRDDQIADCFRLIRFRHFSVTDYIL